MKIIIYLCIRKVLYNITIKTMDSNLISDKRYLFASSIVDDALDDWSEERRTEMIISITEIKEAMMKEYHQPKSAEIKHEKVSK